MRDPPSIHRLSKRDALCQLLEDGMTMIYLDARQDGVDVPEPLRGDSNLRLNLSRRFPRPLSVGDVGVEAVLSFGGEPYTCVVPWVAVFGMFNHVTHKELLWPDDIPRDLLEGAATSTEALTKKRKIREHPRGRPRLQAVPDPGPVPVEEVPVADPAEPSPPKRGHLRLVK